MPQSLTSVMQHVLEVSKGLQYATYVPLILPASWQEHHGQKDRCTKAFNDRVDCCISKGSTLISTKTEWYSRSISFTFVSDVAQRSGMQGKSSAPGPAAKNKQMDYQRLKTSSYKTSGKLTTTCRQTRRMAGVRHPRRT